MDVVVVGLSVVVVVVELSVVDVVVVIHPLAIASFIFTNISFRESKGLTPMADK